MKRTVILSLCLVAVAAVGFADPAQLEQWQFANFGIFERDTSMMMDCLRVFR